MIKKLLIASFCVSAVAMPVRAGWGEGFLLGGFAGLTTGLVATAIARNCQPDVVFVEDPVVVYEEPYVIYEPQVVYEQRVCKPCSSKARRVIKRTSPHMVAAPKKEIIKKKVVETNMMSSAEEIKNKELALKEQELKLTLIQEEKELLREKNKEKELALKEKELELVRLKALDKTDK